MQSHGGLAAHAENTRNYGSFQTRCVSLQARHLQARHRAASCRVERRAPVSR